MCPKFSTFASSDLSLSYLCHKGSSINDAIALWGRRYQGFCDNSTKALALKSVKNGGGVSKIIKNCVTSFMDDP